MLLWNPEMANLLSRMRLITSVAEPEPERLITSVAEPEPERLITSVAEVNDQCCGTRTTRSQAFFCQCQSRIWWRGDKFSFWGLIVVGKLRQYTLWVVLFNPSIHIYILCLQCGPYCGGQVRSTPSAPTTCPGSSTRRPTSSSCPTTTCWTTRQEEAHQMIEPLPYAE